MAKSTKSTPAARKSAARRAPAKKAAPRPKAKASPARPKGRSAPPARSAARGETLPGISKPKVAPEVARPTIVPVPRGDGRFHLLSLSFLREGDEFLARLETGTGQITELKNRSLDLLLRLAADELEDFLE
jgi:hypothetical protein